MYRSDQTEAEQEEKRTPETHYTSHPEENWIHEIQLRL